MKQTQRLFSGLIGLAMMVAFAANVNAQEAPAGSAKVLYINGSARWSQGSTGIWQPLKVGDILRSGALIQTAGNDSYVDLILNNEKAMGRLPGTSTLSTSPAAGSGGGGGAKGAKQDTIRVYADTVLAIDKLTYYQTGADTVSETQLDLKAGKIYGTVKHLSPASRYEIKIPTGVAGIRGTTYFVTADGIVGVLDGEVWVSYVGPDGTVQTQRVVAGEQFDVKTGTLSPVQPPANPAPPFIGTTPEIFAIDHTTIFVSPAVIIPTDG